MTPSQNSLDAAKLSGMILMCVGVACLGINDTMAKMLADSYSPMQILFMRNILALPIAFLLAITMQGKGALKSKRPVIHVIRGVFWVLATLLFFTSIKYVGLAKSTALLLIAPLLVVAIAAIFLKERADWIRWATVLFGLVGALIIIRPGLAAFEPLALLPIAAALMAAFLMLSARWVDESESFWTLLLYLTGASALIGAIAVPFFWVPLLAEDLYLFLGVAIFGTAGMVFITQAFRMAPAVLIAPLDYTALIWATLFGWLFWSETPDLLSFIGAFIIILCGIISIVTSHRSST